MAYSEITDLLDKYFDGLTSKAEEATLRAFYASSDSLPKELEYAKIYFQSINTEREQEAPCLQSNALIKYWYLWGGVAASILLIIGFLFLEYNNSMEYISKQNTGHKAQKVKLGNGVVAWLNHGAEISFLKAEEAGRTIVIRGEVYFEVNVAQQLTVVTEDIKVFSDNLVAFNINADEANQHVLVTVNSGAVQVAGTDSENDMALLLVENNYCSINKKHKLMLSAHNANNNYLSWKTGELVFEQQPMASVVDALQQYYGVRVILDNNQLAYCEYSGQFKNKTLHQVLRGIQTELPIVYRELPGGVLLLGESCKMNEL